MDRSVLTLTLDTTLLFEYWMQGSKVKVVERLLQLAGIGEVDLAVTARIREDVPNDPLASRINSLPEIGITETGSITRLGYWVLGRDMLASDEFENFYSKACTLVETRVGKRRIPGWKDWDHLHAHLLLKRTYFLTWDEGIRCLAPELRDCFGIAVLSPEDFLGQRDQATMP